MNSVHRFDPNDVLPRREDVYGLQGIPPSATVPGSIRKLFDDAVEIYFTCAAPVGIMSDVSVDDFTRIFRGEGNNADDAVLQLIYPHADHLSLVAVTLGEGIAHAARKLVKAADFAVGAMLDSVASCAVERAVETCESLFADALADRAGAADDLRVLNYSPGYCGWHVSGQKKLFEYLDPGQIGITLNDSSLMTPIKSTTGVLVGGKREIHYQDQCKFSYCDECKDRTCVGRVRTLRDAYRRNDPKEG